MDCAAEERLVGMALDGRLEIRSVEADLGAREISVIHEGSAEEIAALIRPLNFGAAIVETAEASDADAVRAPSDADEARTLQIVLAINAGMFVAEVAAAIVGDSSALLADSLDMFADATVYGIALFGVHRAQATQLKAARVSGVLQLLLAFGAFEEVVRRALVAVSPRRR